MNESLKLPNGTSGLLASSSTWTNTGLLLWCASFGVVAFATVLGNSLFLATFFSTRVLRKQRNYLLVSLACADMLVGAVSIPMFIFLVIVTHIEKSKLTHRTQLIYIAVDICTGLTSMFTLPVIAIERLYAVSYPMYYRGLRKRAYTVMVLVPWFIAGLLTVAHIASAFDKVLLNVYIYTLAILTLLSVFAILLSYIIVWIKFKSHKKKSDKLFGPQRQRSSEHERSLVVALFIVTVLFVTTWLPLHIMNILVNFDKTLMFQVSIHAVFFAKLLQYSNSFCNPIVYSLKIPDVKKSTMRLLRCQFRIKETRV